MSKFESVNNFIKSLKQEFKPEWTGSDGEYFKENKFYVDKTCLCKVKNNIMYLSVNSITPKCALYIGELARLSNDANLTVVYVPQWYSTDERTHEFSQDEIIHAYEIVVENLKDRRDIYSKQQLNDSYEALKFINSNCFNVPKTLLNSAANVLKLMEEALQLKDKKVKDFIKEHSYYEVVQTAYFDKDTEVTFRTALKRYLNPSGEYAFLRANFTTGMIYSSECYCGMPKEVMTIEEGYECAKAYIEGTARHGQKYGKYTIMRVMDSYIQVSCNRYSRAMFESIYQELCKHRITV